MTVKTDEVHRSHIIECISLINTYYTDASSLNDAKTFDAILRRLQTMAESCQKLSSEFKKQHSAMDWGKISGFRNILVHDYLGNIDPGIIQNILDNELQPLSILLTA